VLEEEAALLEDPRLWSPNARRSPLEMRRGNGPPRRLGGGTVEVPQSRWGVLTLARGVCVPGRIAWCTTQGE